MKKIVLLLIITLGCGGNAPSIRNAKGTNDCPLDNETYDPPFLKEVATLPQGIECLAFPLRNADRLSRWFRDERHLFLPGKHTGIDIPVDVGTIVMAPASGTIIYAQPNSSDTNIVRIEIGEGWQISFVHLRAISVTEGQHVVKGQIIGLSGGAPGDPGAGPCTTGPHLHYGLTYQKEFADPLAYSCM